MGVLFHKIVVESSCFLTLVDQTLLLQQGERND